MALESFYGGKQGVSPVIKAKFKYINTEDPAYQGRNGHTTKLTKEEARWLSDALNESYNEGDNHTWDKSTLKPFTMDECLKDVHYTDVWYGELCIIDTDNKLNPYNGMLFKRTLKQYNNRFAGTELTLYAEYIGQIVGPSGGVPNFDFGSLDTERGKAVGLIATYDTETAPLDNSNWNYSYPENASGTLTTNTPDEIGDIAVLSAAQPGGNSANIQMVPGKNGTEYNDTIKYTWCNVRRKLDGKDDDAWVYLGFEIPYSWFDVNREEIPYWDARTNLLDHTFSADHPFYHDLHFYIPRGARGIGPEELFVVGKDGHNKPATLYDFDAITYDQSTDIYSVDTNKIKTPTDLTYWVAKWRLYNPKTTDVTDIYQYISAYKDIKSVRLSDDGKLEIQYSDNNTWHNLGTITWIDNVDVAIDTDSTHSTYGDFTIKIDFNSKLDEEDYTYTNNLHLIKDIIYTDNTGKIKFDYSDINGRTLSKTPNGKIEYDKNISINHTPTSDDYGKVTITKNTGNSRIAATLPLIKNANYNKDTGEITFTYSGLVGDQIVGTIEYISKMRITDNGTIQYKYNTDDNNASWRDITNSTNNTPIKIKDIKDANIDDNTGHLIITYRDDSTKDVGQVKTKPIVSPVLRIKNASDPNYVFPTTTAVEDLLNGTTDYVDPQDNTTIVKNDGTIKVSGQDSTGGIIIANVDRDSYIYYYDPAQGNWINLGTFGTSNAGGTSAENLAIEKQDSESSDSNYKVTFKEGSFITFKDGTNNVIEEAPIKWPWIDRSLT